MTANREHLHVPFRTKFYTPMSLSNTIAPTHTTHYTNKTL